MRRGSTGQVVSRQSGVIRTNCIDCLDRTNVVQGVLARKVGLCSRVWRIGNVQSEEPRQCYRGNESTDGY